MWNSARVSCEHLQRDRNVTTIHATTSTVSNMKKESPDYLQVSTAAAIALGLKRGRFWRGAKLRCANLLLTYADGCKGACQYCGLNRHRLQRTTSNGANDSTFIRVGWPTFSTDEIISALRQTNLIERVCIAMVTHKRATRDTIALAEKIHNEVGIPISGLITPTLLDTDSLEELRRRGVDKIGIAFDAATLPLFRRLRGLGEKAWNIYWRRFEECVRIFGEGQVGSHFIVGLGETEREMAFAMQRVRDMGGVNHLFSFYPEVGTSMERIPPPPIAQYRRIQLAAEIIDSGLASARDFEFSDAGEIVSFGIPPEELERLMDDGRAFMTRGCTGKDGRVACNRPFANSLPGEGLRNYPFEPTAEDIALIRKQLSGEWRESRPARRRRPARRLKRMLFFAPSIKHFETEEFRPSGKPVFVPVSITGTSCALGCKYCEGELLRRMKVVRNPAELWQLVRSLVPKGCEGILLTGGCDENGIVPLAPYCETLWRLKVKYGLRTAVHTKFVDEPLARELAMSGCDIVMIDVVGSDETLREIYNLPHRRVADVIETLDLSEKYSLPLAPHIVMGAHHGEMRGEYRALEMLKDRELAALVIVMLMPLRRGDGWRWRIEPKQIRDFFLKARRDFPDIPVLLGCARPMGKLQEEIDETAVECGFDGIAYPSDAAVALARGRGLTVEFSEHCCAMIAAMR